MLEQKIMNDYNYAESKENIWDNCAFGKQHYIRGNSGESLIIVIFFSVIMLLICNCIGALCINGSATDSC